jgi:hypothetical protein
MSADGDPKGLWSTVSRLGHSLLGALPPAFVMLVLVNAIFLATVMWFLTHQMDQRNALVGRLLDRCMQSVPN